jgi:hypothetical protein
MLHKTLGLATSLAMLIATPEVLAQEKLVGTYGEARTSLAFAIPDATLQKFLPAGWVVNPFAAGPSEGANLVVTFMDWLSVQDPDGKPAKTYRSVGYSVPAKQSATGTTASMTIGGLSAPSDYAPGPYGNSVAAKGTITRAMHTDNGNVSSAEETWQFEGVSGDSIQMQLQFVRGVAARSKLESKVYSAVTPDFYRIYRVEQAVDVVRSAALGSDSVHKYTFTASGPLLSQLFNGQEQLISITSLPWLSRQAYLPVSRAE